MQDRQIVLPVFMRKADSPLLSPQMKSRVKMMMSQTAFLGMTPPEEPAACQRADGMIS
jgi:hypothetical protein